MEYDFITIFEVVRQHSPYSSWKQTGDNEYRDTDNKNPHLALTKFGLHDHKNNQMTPITAVATELGIDITQFAGTPDTGKTRDTVTRTLPPGTLEALSKPKATDPKAPWNDPKKHNENEIWKWKNAKPSDLISQYFRTRGIIQSKEFYTDGLKARLNTWYNKKDQREVTEILVPLISPHGSLTQLLAIEINQNDSTKIRKRIRGRISKNVSSCIVFGSLQKYDTSYILEGIEDALTYWTHCLSPEERKNTRMLVTCGGSGYGKVAEFLDTESTDAKPRKTFAILDNDKNMAGIKSALKLPAKGVTLLLPDSEGDLNDTLMCCYPGSSVPVDAAMKGFREGLEEVSRAQIIEMIKSAETKEQPVTVLANEVVEELPEMLRLAHSNQKLQKHLEMVLGCFHEVRKDLITGGMYARTGKNEEFLPLERYKELIRAVARFHHKDEGINVCLAQECISLIQFAPGTKGELLIDIPEWDGTERINEILAHITPKNINQQHMIGIIREWLAKAWLRVEDPSIDQQLLCLVGPQGAGKDVLTEALVGGFGYYFQPISLSNDQNKLERAMGECLVGLISEFDKSKFADASIIKDMITKQRLNYDQKYVAGQIKIPNRCSFIASSNTLDVLTDSTGNRRHRIIEIDNIEIKKGEHNYPGDIYDPKRLQSQQQVLAEIIVLANSGKYHASQEALEAAAITIEELTPESAEELLLENWFSQAQSLVDRRLAELPEGNADRAKWLGYKQSGMADMKDLDDAVSKCGYKKIYLQRTLHRMKHKFRNKNIGGEIINTVYRIANENDVWMRECGELDDIQMPF